MTPDQRFARRVRSAIVAFVLLFAYFLAADLWMPITPQAQLTRPVLRLAPRISGQVLDIAVTNNAHVEAGQLLFRLDPEPFLLAVNAAELALEQAAQDNAELDASLAAARADKLAAEASAQELARETERLGKLMASQHVSRQLFEQTQSQRAAARAKVAAATARIHQLAAERGAAGDGNLRLRQARNALDQARLQLQYSEVRAERAGTLSNLQLSPGAFVAAGSPVAALVADEADVSADFREKALRYVGLGDGASVVFDALPGRIFAARVSAIDAGVKEGQLDANGDLAAPATSDRWVRDAQRQRLHVLLDAPPEAPLPSGAKATVQLYPHESPLAAFFGRVQIRLISLLHYIY
ncbi:secretion protein [Pseudomonas tohonis]|uniref:Secretion protein n=1 Tax=Pseudomonas tohonis TaxID=2725477 RepID=A0A6J4EEP9_9PSED|nr:HlyD family secretion protein [Pseudomonas tohonis]BCG27746.1 secretion protein [Pseudomonas tohonis]GJN54123.1 secretion protein [Pseudomonas tohonis]